MKILFIEPDHILAANYQMALEQFGHQIDWQTDAQAAITAIDENLPDVIVLEIQMPLHNGIEFLYEFHSYPEWQHIPVIVLSLAPAEEFSDGAELLSRLGVRKYLYKPQAKLSDLCKAVERLSLNPASSGI